MTQVKTGRAVRIDGPGIRCFIVADQFRTGSRSGRGNGDDHVGVLRFIAVVKKRPVKLGSILVPGNRPLHPVAEFHDHAFILAAAENLVQVTVFLGLEGAAVLESLEPGEFGMLLRNKHPGHSVEFPIEFIRMELRDADRTRCIHNCFDPAIGNFKVDSKGCCRQQEKKPSQLPQC